MLLSGGRYSGYKPALSRGCRLSERNGSRDGKSGGAGGGEAENGRGRLRAAAVAALLTAALEQRRAIQILRDRGALETLSPKLREAAQLREAHPELSLAQLAALCEPPVTKSSLSHRLRKLIQLSAQDTAP